MPFSKQLLKGLKDVLYSSQGIQAAQQVCATNCCMEAWRNNVISITFYEVY